MMAGAQRCKRKLLSQRVRRINQGRGSRAQNNQIMDGDDRSYSKHNVHKKVPMIEGRRLVAGRPPGFRALNVWEEIGWLVPGLILFVTGSRILGRVREQ
jgi:hypothetical protein